MSEETKYILEVNDLHTSFFTENGEVCAVNGISMNLEPGKTLGIVGESGSGKSVTAYSIMQILAETGKITSGEVKFRGEDITKWSEAQMTKFRGSKCSIIFQDPMTSLNPVFTIGSQLEEAILLHTDKNKQQAKERAVEMLTLVGVNEPEKRVKQYPHELSGGMRQRVMIAMALACEPDILIADEPTTALDVTIQAQILELMQDLQKKLGMAIIMVTHDLGVIASMCDEIMVMYGGRVCERGTADDTAIFAAYNSNDLDFIDSIPNDEIQSVINNSDFYKVDQLGTYYIGFNVNAELFEGKTVEQAAKMREALSLMMDRSYIADQIGQTGQIPADAFVPAGMADGNGGIFNTADDEGYYDATATGPQQAEAAMKLLEEAGYTFTDNGDGTYTCSPAISMTYLTNEGTGHEAIAQVLQGDFKTIGIDMSIEVREWNVFLEDRKAGNFTIAREGWVADFNDPINMLEIFLSTGGNNDMQLGKEDNSYAPEWDAYDALLEEIRTTTDFANRVDLMHQAEDMLMDTWAVIPLYYYNDVYMQKDNVDGIYSTVFGMKYFMYATKSAE